MDAPREMFHVKHLLRRNRSRTLSAPRGSFASAAMRSLAYTRFVRRVARPVRTRVPPPATISSHGRSGAPSESISYGRSPPKRMHGPSDVVSSADTSGDRDNPAPHARSATPKHQPACRCRSACAGHHGDHRHSAYRSSRWGTEPHPYRAPSLLIRETPLPAERPVEQGGTPRTSVVPTMTSIRSGRRSPTGSSEALRVPAA